MKSYYPLHYAARGGFTAAIQLLIDRNVDVNVLDSSDVRIYHFKILLISEYHINTSAELSEQTSLISSELIIYF